MQQDRAKVPQNACPPPRRESVPLLEDNVGSDHDDSVELLAPFSFVFPLVRAYRKFERLVLAKL